MTIKILKARESHIPDLLEVWKEFMDFHAAIRPHFTRSAEGHLVFAKHLRECMGSPESCVFVADDGEKVIGYTLLHLKKPPPVYDDAVYGFISDMAVKSEYRRHGVGEKLLKRAMTWFKSKGARRVEMAVVVGNSVGYPFWRKQGFEEFISHMFKEID
jgi:GNAT superfamily N-acetyltransferase